MHSIQPITNLLENELASVNEAILSNLSSNVELINQIGNYMIQSGGKRIRPIVHLLCAHACGNFSDKSIVLAALIEFIHSATLLHDDVVDGSALRRGRPTANQVWDNPTAVLVGDFLYSRSFQMMVSLDNMESMRVLADATNQIAQGEVLQLAHRFQPDVDEESYLNVIRLKTAKLFEAAAQLGTHVDDEPQVKQRLAAYGLHLGTAFQLVDDYLDYSAPNAEWGKQVGKDLSEGKATLPLIYALKKSDKTQAKMIRDILTEGSLNDFGVIHEILSATGAFTYTLKRAETEVIKAKEAIGMLPKSTYRDALYYLATFAIERSN